MPTNIDISRPQGSTAQLLFNIVDESGNPIDVTDWTNFELSTYVEPAIEFGRAVTFTDSNTSGTFSEDVRVIVGESYTEAYNDYIPRLLSTDAREVTLFKGRGNRFSVTVSHDGDSIDLSVFTRMELYGLTDSPIDSDVTDNVIDWNDGSGVINIDAGEVATATGTAKTTLIGYSSSHPEGVVLWHPSLAQAHITVNLINA